MRTQHRNDSDEHTDNSEFEVTITYYLPDALKNQGGLRSIDALKNQGGLRSIDALKNQGGLRSIDTLKNQGGLRSIDALKDRGGLRRPTNENMNTRCILAPHLHEMVMPGQGQRLQRGRTHN